MLFLLKIRTNWRIFETESNLLSACSICNKIVSILRNNSSELIIPEENTECSNPNSKNIYCRFINDITKNIKDKFKDKIPQFACSIVGPCIQPTSQNSTGELCFQCRYLSSIALEYRPGDRILALQKFCSSSRTIFSDICQKIEEEKHNKYYQLIDKSKNISYPCIQTGYCNSNYTKIYKHRTQQKDDL